MMLTEILHCVKLNGSKIEKRIKLLIKHQVCSLTRLMKKIKALKLQIIITEE